MGNCKAEPGPRPSQSDSTVAIDERLDTINRVLQIVVHGFFVVIQAIGR